MPETFKFDADTTLRLESLFVRYPAGNHCDTCADLVTRLMIETGYGPEIVTLQNEEIPVMGIRPPYIRASKPDGSLFVLGENGFHQAVRIHVSDQRFYLDALVYVHCGAVAIEDQLYWGLFEYPDGIEITAIHRMR